MNKEARKIVIQVFEADLKKRFGPVQNEVVFNKIMPTKRRFRADYFVPTINCIIEINGGQWISGRHNRGGKGYEDDLTKMNLAIKNGFYYLQYTYEMLGRGDYIEDLDKMIEYYTPF